MSAGERTVPEMAYPSVGEDRTGLAPVGSARAATAAPADPAAVWTAPEPWTKRLWRAAKVWVASAVTYYTLMPLVGDAEVSVRRAAFISFWAAAVSFVGSRTGNMMPASPMLVFGGVTFGVSVLVGATALYKGASVPEAGAIVSIGLFLSGVMLWMGLKARRAERELAEGQRTGRVAPVLVSRAELASRIEEHQVHQAAEARVMVRRLAIGAGVVIGLGLFPYARVFGAELPEIVGFGLFFGMWGAFGLYARSLARKGREVAVRFGLICSACRESFHGAFVNHRFVKNIVEIGRCPRCGARIVTEDGT